MRKARKKVKKDGESDGENKDYGVVKLALLSIF